MIEKEELQSLLLRAAVEIRNLRRNNEILAAKVHVLDILGAIVLPRQGVEISEDIAWKLEQYMEKKRDQDIKQAQQETELS